MNKRIFSLVGFSLVTLAHADSTYTPPPIHLEPLAQFVVELDAPTWDLGNVTEEGSRRIIPITGGYFKGKNFNGKILSQGADWQIRSNDGSLSKIDTRYLLQTDDGALIYLQTNGYRYSNPNIVEKTKAGELIDPKNYYFRMTMKFETSSAKYAWLNHTIAVASIMSSISYKPKVKSITYDAYIIK